MLIGRFTIVDYLVFIMEDVHAALLRRLVDTLRFERVFLASNRHCILTIFVPLIYSHLYYGWE